MTNTLDFLSEMDELFGKSPSKPKAAKPKTSFPAKPEAPSYWQPVAIVLATATWQCSCGNHGHDRPRTLLRETFGRQSRLREIHGSKCFAHLPREIEHLPPTEINECEACFSISPIGEPQLEFAFPADLEIFRRALTSTVIDALEREELRETLPQIISGHATQIPGESLLAEEYVIDFDHGAGHGARYHLNLETEPGISGDFYCTKESY